MARPSPNWVKEAHVFFPNWWRGSVNSLAFSAETRRSLGLMRWASIELHSELDWISVLFLLNWVSREHGLAGRNGAQSCASLWNRQRISLNRHSAKRTLLKVLRATDWLHILIELTGKFESFGWISVWGRHPTASTAREFPCEWLFPLQFFEM